MHEFALADAVAKAAVQAAREADMDRVETVTVRVGELQQIEPELFEFSLTQVLAEAEPVLQGARFVVEREPVAFHCRVCGRTFGTADLPQADADQVEAMHFLPELAHAFVRCPSCGRPDFDIVAGRGVTLERVEGQGGGPASG
jgi:hydrogenase nickel incorporation protein HypA/HybF